jgi:hypothetical protein
VRRVGGELSVNGQTAVNVIDPDGSFVLTADARLDDQLELRYSLDGELSRLTLRLDRALRSFLVQPETDGGIPDLEEWLVPGTEPGYVRVRGLVEPPYLVYNAERGQVAYVDEVGEIDIEAEPGELVCVAQLDAGASTATTSDCLPAP